MNAYYGAVPLRDANANVANSHSDQLLAGAAYTTLDKKLTLRGTGEISAALRAALPCRTV